MVPQKALFSRDERMNYTNLIFIVLIMTTLVHGVVSDIVIETPSDRFTLTGSNISVTWSNDNGNSTIFDNSTIRILGKVVMVVKC